MCEGFFAVAFAGNFGPTLEKTEKRRKLQKSEKKILTNEGKGGIIDESPHKELMQQRGRAAKAAKESQKILKKLQKTT